MFKVIKFYSISNSMTLFESELEVDCYIWLQAYLPGIDDNEFIVITRKV